MMEKQKENQRKENEEARRRWQKKRDRERGYSNEDAVNIAKNIIITLKDYAKKDNHIKAVYLTYDILERMDSFSVTCGIVTKTSNKLLHVIKNDVDKIIVSFLKKGMYFDVEVVNNEGLLKNKYDLHVPAYKKEN